MSTEIPRLDEFAQGNSRLEVARAASLQSAPEASMLRRQGECLYPGFCFVFLWELGWEREVQRRQEVYWVSRERKVEFRGRNSYFLKVLSADGAVCVCLWSHSVPCE